MTYLLRDDSCGFRTVDGDPVDRDRRPLRPWAITPTNDVVYSPWNQQSGGIEGILQRAMLGFQSRTPLASYDRAVSQSRRRMFDTSLAAHAASHPEFSQIAVGLVSANLIKFVGDRQPSVNGGAKELGDTIRRRCFSNTGSGRLGTAKDGEGTDDETAWKRALAVLRSGSDIPKVLGIHNALANVLTRSFGFDGHREAIYKATAARVSPSEGYLYSWFKPGAAKEATEEDGLRRGRTRVSEPATAAALPGVTRPGDHTGQSGVESRIRGIDMWAPMEGSAFARNLEMRNLAFGAGRSGTTGELLKAYRTFGSADSDENFKQYLFAIVAYLVGGGHHSCHEIFSIANLLVGAGGPQSGRAAAGVSEIVRDAYVPGKYIKHLPASYLNSPEFKELKTKFYDIAMLGHLHGTFV